MQKTKTRRWWWRAGGPLGLAALAATVGILITSGGAGARSLASPPSNTAPPTVSGDARAGSTLSASSGSWSGATPMDFNFQWLRCDKAGASCGMIPGATGQNRVVDSADVGYTLRVRVTATNSDGSATADSSPTAVVGAPAAPVNSGLPVISGTLKQGSTLTTSNGSWKADPAPTYKYEWGRCDANGNNCSIIAGATGQSYTLQAADVGKRMRSRVTATNSAGSADAISSPTGVVQALGTPPKNTSLPAISGSATEGQILRLALGSWSGSAPVSYGYQWQRCDANGNNCANIAGAVGTSWKLTSASVSRTIRVVVTASNAVGKATAVTRQTTVVQSAGPAGAIKLPSGETSIPASSVPTTERLVVSGIQYSPSTVTARNSMVTARYRVKDTRGYVVRGALVLVTPLPYVWATAPHETQTGTDGWASVQFRVQARVPKKSAIVIFVRARKPGGSILAGVSSRRLTQVLVNAR